MLEKTGVPREKHWPAIPLINLNILNTDTRTTGTKRILSSDVRDRDRNVRDRDRNVRDIDKNVRERHRNVKDTDRNVRDRDRHVRQR